MIRLATCLALGLCATPLVAQQGNGTITGTLDLDPASWTVASSGEGPMSAWSEGEEGTEIRLVGTPGAQEAGGAGTLTIEIDLEAGAVEARPTDVRVELRQADGTLIAGSDNIDLTLEAYQASQDELALAGSLVATMTPEPSGELVIDPEAGVTFDGNFQATIPAAESGDQS